MMKDLSEAMYYRTLTKAMDESDPEEVLEMFERYGDVGRRYYDHYRYANGRFAPKGSGTYRRGYDEPPYYHITPEKYRTKRNYTETKELHKSNTPEDKEHNMKSLETYMAELARDVSGMVNDMSPEEKALTKTKLTALVNKIQ